MSVTITINGEERRYDRTVERWIAQRLRDLSHHSAPICVKVGVSGEDINVLVSSGGCSGGGGGRRPNVREAELLAMWEKRGLNEVEINAGKLIAFLHQVAG